MEKGNMEKGKMKNENISNLSAKVEIDFREYEDKVLGAWIGKSIGGIVGAPFESHKIRGDFTADQIWPDKLMPNDDLDIQVAWLELMEERGCFFTHQDMIEIWQDRCWYNFAEYGHFLNNVQRGIAPPLSGGFNNEFFRESMGCPIRAEIWGLVSPGNPELAACLAKMDGELDHIRESVYAEQFWAAATASAFFSNNLDDVLSSGRKVVPDESAIAFISSWVPELWLKHRDWKRVWTELIRKFGDRDSSKGPIDFGFAVLSLVANDGDLKKTVAMCVNCGWDVDCTAATAAALLGTLNGAKRIPADWREKTGADLKCDINVKHKNASLEQFARDTCMVGIEMGELRNHNIVFGNVPENAGSEVSRRIASRPAVKKIEISVEYPAGPVLKRDGASEATLLIANRSAKPLKGKLELSVPDRLEVSPESSDVLSVSPGGLKKIHVELRRKQEEQFVWDKNIVMAGWKDHDTEKKTEIKFGFAGARQWTVYGPYWDGWDTVESKECPFRNAKVTNHPCHMGHGKVMYRNFVDIDREYLDEKRLLTGAVPEEWPFLVERGEDWITESDLGGFKGEAVYYFVRELVSETPIDCMLTVGCTSSFKAWLNGNQILKCDGTRTWTPGGFGPVVKLDRQPSRLVIKTARVTDEFTLSLCYIKKDVPGDKTVGVSYLLDCVGDRLISG